MSDVHVVHLGRAGDVAGGMTQVVNGILAWRFRRCTPVLLRTRSGVGVGRDLLLWIRSSVHLLGRPAGTVVVGHLSQGGSFVREGLLLVLGRLRGLRVIAHLHGSGFSAYARRRPRLVRLVLGSTAAVIVLSEEAERVVSAVVPGVDVRLIPNTTSCAPSVDGARDDIVLFAGLVSHRKGVDVLLRSWRRIEHGGWRLLVVGPCDPEFVPERTDSSVEFTGRLEHAELMALLCSAKIAVLPSRAEAMPVFLLEAMSRGMAVVASDVGGVPHLVGDAGIVLPAGDVDSLAAALLELIDDESALSAWSDRALARFEARFSPTIVYDQMEACWLGP